MQGQKSKLCRNVQVPVICKGELQEDMWILSRYEIVKFPLGVLINAYVIHRSLINITAFSFQAPFHVDLTTKGLGAK